ncbi:MAG: HNH endonuclease [Psychroflexus salarius]
MTKNQEEEWRTVELEPQFKENQSIEVSNLGDARRIKKTGKTWPVKLGNINGYASVSITLKAGGNRSRYLHKLIAETFLDKRDDQIFVIHKDYDKQNNHVSNLAWANKKEKEKHQFKNPKWLAKSKMVKNSKLSEDDVRKIKRMLNSPNRKYKMRDLAKKFQISEMQLYRIKKGKNWTHIKI